MLLDFLKSLLVHVDDNTCLNRGLLELGLLLVRLLQHLLPGVVHMRKLLHKLARPDGEVLALETLADQGVRMGQTVHSIVFTKELTRPQHSNLGVSLRSCLAHPSGGCLLSFDKRFLLKA